MGALTFDALLRSLKRGAPDPVYYLYGDEDVLKDEAIRAVLYRAVAPGARVLVLNWSDTADLTSGADAYARKTFRPHELIDAVVSTSGRSVK